jgi:GST-like protein
VLAELGLEYETHAINAKAGETRTPEFTRLNPNQKVPVLVDGEVTIWESGAILLYLADKHQRFLPKAAAQRAEALKLLFFEACVAATLGGPSGIADQMRREERERNVAQLEDAKRELTRQVNVIESVLADGRSYLAHEYSIADMQLFPVLRRGEMYGVISAPPFTRAWLSRVFERERVKVALG